MGAPYSNTGSSWIGGRPHDPRFDTGVVPDRVDGIRSNEGKAAKRFIAELDKHSFDAMLFGYIVYTFGNGIRSRVMQVVKGIIIQYARAFDAGDMDDDTRDAKRMADLLDMYERESF